MPRASRTRRFTDGWLAVCPMVLWKWERNSLTSAWHAGLLDDQKCVMLGPLEKSLFPQSSVEFLRKKMGITRGHGEKLSRKQEQAIAALLEQPTIDAAAQVVGVSERTIRNWLKVCKFQVAHR